VPASIFNLQLTTFDRFFALVFLLRVFALTPWLTNKKRTAIAVLFLKLPERERIFRLKILDFQSSILNSFSPNWGKNYAHENPLP
jgi:hypothetical protein